MRDRGAYAGVVGGEGLVLLERGAGGGLGGLEDGEVTWGVVRLVIRREWRFTLKGYSRGAEEVTVGC